MIMDRSCPLSRGMLSSTYLDRSFFEAAEIPVSEHPVVLVGLQTRPPTQTQLPRAPAPIRDFALLQRGGKMESVSKEGRTFVGTSQ
jgi:hypothetical protein